MYRVHRTSRQSCRIRILSPNLPINKTEILTNLLSILSDWRIRLTCFCFLAINPLSRRSPEVVGRVRLHLRIFLQTQQSLKDCSPEILRGSSTGLYKRPLALHFR